MKNICDKTGLGLPEEAEILSLAKEDCPVAWALNVAKISRLNSCGKGTLCRDGMNQVWQIIRDITTSRGKNGDIILLKELCEMIILAADCELSTKAAHLVMRSLTNYKEEWDAHITRKRCTALICKDYYTVHIDPIKCTGCNKCIPVCLENAIAGSKGLIHIVDNAVCSKCGACFSVCPTSAFLKAGAIKPRCPEFPVPVGSLEESQPRRRRREIQED